MTPSRLKSSIEVLNPHLELLNNKTLKLRLESDNRATKWTVIAIQIITSRIQSQRKQNYSYCLQQLPVCYLIKHRKNPCKNYLSTILSNTGKKPHHTVPATDYLRSSSQSRQYQVPSHISNANRRRILTSDHSVYYQTRGNKLHRTYPLYYPWCTITGL
jgi:hypothetical protein